MIIEFLLLPAVIVAFLTAAVIMVSWDWRISIVALAVQYVSVFILVSVSWSWESAVVKLVAGWMAVVVLSLALINLPKGQKVENRRVVPDIIFRSIAAVLAGLFAFTGGTKLAAWFPMVSVEQAYGALLLVALGIIQLGLTTHPLRVVLGLLTVLSGFGILYAAVENSILMTGMLAIITLGLSFVGAYLLTAPSLEAAQ
jgi:hypothetical protein